MKTDVSISTIIKNLGINALNEMQQTAQSTILTEKDILLLSPTGSGKTLAFLLPVLQLLNKNDKEVQCLVIVPSRELGLQIEKVWKQMGTGYKVNICYGGHSMETELNNLSSPPALLIGTPGRLTDHLTRKSFDPSTIHTLILDEFDKSLELGFHEDMETIISQLSHVQKKVLTSATSDIEIPDFVNISSPKILKFTKEETNEQLSIRLVLSPEKDKLETLLQLICSFHSEPALIFCNHREAAERISDFLNTKGIQANYYHGGMDQDDRERVLIQFRNKSLNYLVTTDLAARGLDIPEMKHVIHYHLPSKESEFTHRNGRTARMHNSGTAYVLLYKEEPSPDYLPNDLEILQIHPGSLPEKPEFQTLYISGGKKNKLNKGDIVGFFLQKGKLPVEDLGLIEVKDFISFAAVRSSQVQKLLERIKTEKMKGKKYKIEIARNSMKKRD